MLVHVAKHTVVVPVAMLLLVVVMVMVMLLVKPAHSCHGGGARAES